MRRVLVIALALTSLAVLAPAQNEPTDDGRPGRNRPRRDGVGRGPGGGAVGPEEMVRRLAEQLQLTPEQQPQFDALVAKYQPRWQEAQGRTEEMRQLALEFRQARESGDTQRAEQIAEQMRAAGGGRGSAVREFMTEVETILTPEQRERLNTFRQSQRDRWRPGGGQMRDLLARLPDELQLTAEQRAQYDELLAQQRGGEGRREQMREMRPLIEQLRQAREQGDTQRVAELEKQIAELRGARRPGGPGGAGGDPWGGFFEQLNAILTETQQAKLAELRAQARQSGPPRPETQGPADVRRVLEAARRLDLNEQQRDQLRDIIREATRVLGQTGLTPEAKAELARTTKNQVIAILDAQQAEEFERMLARGARIERQKEGAETAKPADEGSDTTPPATQPARKQRDGGQGGRGGRRP